MKKTIIAVLLLTICVSSQGAFSQSRKRLAPRPKAPAKKMQPSANVTSQDWTTPTEITKYRTTPRYDETMAYFRRIAEAVPQQVRMEKFGSTGEGRDLYIVIVSKDGVFEPTAIHRANRPVVLIQNAIHAGEMDGKDACMALLREMVITRTQAALLDRAVVVIIPIYNADGHERFGPYNRINQNGPEEMGWRTQGQNLNLNRDYLKADAPETRSFLRLWTRWLPDFFVDDHVTDGADYQYDTTYNLNVGADVFPDLAAWQRDQLIPYIEKSVTASGHVIGRYVGVGEANPSTGLTMGQDLPRFSTGYALVQNRPGFLVEQHMLKDYQTRVTGNYELLRALLEIINRDADRLVKANRDADAAASALAASNTSLALRLKPTDKTTEFIFHGFKTVRTRSVISGGERVEYTKEKMDYTIPLRDDVQPTLSVKAPTAYIIPRPWQAVIGVLSAHGVRMKRLATAWTGEVETYRCNASWQERPYEGRHPLAGNAEFGSSGAGLTCETVREKMTFPAGSAVVTMDQRTAKVAAHWLEPMAPDSAVNWGFFNAIFEQKEYGEPYVMETHARRMLERDPKLRKEFEDKLAADPKFAANPFARLNFFYQRSPYWDPKLGLYPVGRVSSLQGMQLN
ncbi:MAG TPA: M14 family metallopeptidase [Terriglobales bacterium]|nr:M14 family metallopeptidase [Terriglobales bacterium]